MKESPNPELMKQNIIDTTLRDGEQAPGVAFSADQKMKIANYLNILGIDEVELGTPSMGEKEVETIRSIARQGFTFKTSSWCRAIQKDIDLAVQCKTSSVNISFPTSDLQLQSLGKSRQWIEQELPLLIEYARDRFETVTIGAQDASRSDLGFLYQFIDMCQHYGANRVRIADTVGVMTPLSTMKLFENIRTRFPKFDIEFHPHNDLGMATANAFMALQVGATSISGTINGIGERSGNCAIEELIVAMELEGKGSYNSKIITEMCKYTEEASKRPLSCSKPIVGDMAFTHESGIHVRSILKNKMSYQPFDESIIGRKDHRIVIGKHSGKAALEYAKANNKIDSKEEENLPKWKQEKRKAKLKVI